MNTSLALVASALAAVGAEAYYQQSYRPAQPSYNSYQPSYNPSYQPSYNPAPHPQYGYRQPYYQAYSYPHTGGNAVPQGWYSATQQFRPIAIPYVAWKGSETIYAACRNSTACGTNGAAVPACTDIRLSQVPGQPINVTFNSVDTSGIGAAAAAVGNKIYFSLRKYGCNANNAVDVTGINDTNNPEFNPIEEKLPDGTGIASFQDATRGRLNSLTAVGADLVNFIGPYTTTIPVSTQADFLQNLVGADGIIGRCIVSSSPILASAANPMNLAAGTSFTTTNYNACDIQRMPPPTNFANPQYTPHHHHFVPQTYNRYPSFPRYNGYSAGGIY